MRQPRSLWRNKAPVLGLLRATMTLGLLWLIGIIRRGQQGESLIRSFRVAEEMLVTNNRYLISSIMNEWMSAASAVWWISAGFSLIPFHFRRRCDDCNSFGRKKWFTHSFGWFQLSSNFDQIRSKLMFDIMAAIKRPLTAILSIIYFSGA